MRFSKVREWYIIKRKIIEIIISFVVVIRIDSTMQIHYHCHLIRLLFVVLCTCILLLSSSSSSSSIGVLGMSQHSHSHHYNNNPTNTQQQQQQDQVPPMIITDQKLFDIQEPPVCVLLPYEPDINNVDNSK
ncbi:hypothetical protein DFA_03665 [Cavenderia fasciculata]|uniref:Uncharacterized protein n=1 Tax=Cavenderia fasciculata TaxID=261658 RepID=F4PII7_CACFS|nr:uncharacterized protein DFA_03665 [Cavenderia fasciculata]EGG25416.1 hypothetical protein DFA_03665 [Cavenderia fasciculata]|eukprot:XP_004363267.1 hypothetical protein DFA_03665 [Cavenderia fasciculata]